ncbi:GDP-fucose protein O-fucosyltransferase 2-like [Tubulanus polymorphus]|uniref:GDP-fucose protein O-fucosyltransferase 2-like n=1 Tax=Tubulanus polymorphus TaxID=672921 RepID=UPI003DA4F5C2
MNECRAVFGGYERVVTTVMEGDVAFFRFFLLKILLFCTICLSCQIVYSEDGSESLIFESENQQTVNSDEQKPMRYLLYEVNPGEGFNLRRDVYMRIANLAKALNAIEPWTLVLPPWGRIYHWKSPSQQTKLRWSQFFDVESLNRHTPVIEFEDFKTLNGPEIDELYYLQNYKEGWGPDGWKEKMDFRECNQQSRYRQDSKGTTSSSGAGVWRGWFWGFDDVVSKKFNCISIQAHAKYLIPFLTKKTQARSVMIDRAETLIHDVYGETDYWQARRSMVFARPLTDVADQFRAKYLNSFDETDKTIFEDDWRTMQRRNRDAIGGPYLAVHLRRLDFLYSHKKSVPSLEGAANRIQQLLKDLKLQTVFVATDAPDDEYGELKWFLKDYKVERFRPSSEELNQFQDGGIAIIDQWICAHARYFIGSSQSTFSFRIHEEREILGFKPKTTFNSFCGDEQSEKQCEQPSEWKIVY